MKSFQEWLMENTAAPEAPTKPATEPKAPPAPSRPARTIPLPFKPPTRPEPANRPKAKKNESVKKKNLIGEGWEDVHGSVRDFIDRLPASHPFSKHDILNMPARGGGTYGSKIAQDSHADAEKKLKKLANGPRPAEEDENTPDERPWTNRKEYIDRESMSAMRQIQQIEYAHKEELQEAAVDLVSNYLGMPSDFFHAYLSRDKEEGMREKTKGGYKADTDKPRGVMPLDKNLRQHINRKITYNMMNQGHALNAMDGLHTQIKDVLEQIDPRLPQLYTKLSHTAKGQFWYSNIIELLQSPEMRKLGAASEVQLVRNEEEDQYEVVATAPVFIFLIQELLKGAFDLMSEHAFPPDMAEEDKKAIIGIADEHADEPWHFLYGPELWRIFVRMIPPTYKKGRKLMNLLMQLNRKDPARVNKILRDMVEEYYEKKEAGVDFTKHLAWETNFGKEIETLMRELEEEIEEIQREKEEPEE
jgi:hypothetical protein